MTGVKAKATARERARKEAEGRALAAQVERGQLPQDMKDSWLYAAARRFQESGLTSWAEWRAIEDKSPVVAAALVRARRDLEHERVLAVAQAVAGLLLPPTPDPMKAAAQAAMREGGGRVA